MHNITNESETGSEDTPKPARKPFVYFPRWWWIYVGFFVGLSFVVSLVENAASQIIFNVTIISAVFLLFLHWLVRGTGSLRLRALPLLLFVGLGVALASVVRIDDMSGNLIPTRVSFRWQPQPDERLAQPEVQTENTGVDLLTRTKDDFPRFLGPNGKLAVEVDLADDWDSNPPKKIWHKSEFGAGWSGFAAVNGYAVTMEQRGDNEIVSCYEIASGDLAWSHAETARHQTVPGGVGPRSTPTIHEGRVYTLGATGILLCLDGASGEVIWKQNLLEAIGTTPEEENDLVQWGRAASPLIDEGRVIVPLGLRKNPDGEVLAGASLIAFDAVTGDELWREGQHQVSYSSPVVGTLDGVRQFVVVCESQLCGHDAATGKQLWEYHWLGNSAGNASCSNPIIVGDTQVFVSKGYAYGSALLDIKQNEGAWSVDKIWHKLTVMKTKFTNAVVHGGHVYGLDDSILSCVDLQTGKRLWKRGRFGHGQVLRAGNHLLVQAESGDVALVALSPDKLREITRFSPIEGKTWNNPCLFGKYLLVRNGQEAACYLLP